MIEIEVLEGKGTVYAVLRELFSAFESFKKGEVSFEGLRGRFGFSIAEAIRRSLRKDCIYFPYRKKYTAFIRVSGNLVEFWLNRRMIGVGRLARSLDPQDCHLGVAFEKGKLVLKLYRPIRGVDRLDEGQALKKYRQLAFAEVPEEFKALQRASVRPKNVFFDRDGTPKPNFELRIIEGYSQVATEGRFLYFWNKFTNIRNRIAMKNTSLIPTIMRQMRVKLDDWDDMMVECTVALLRGVGMWDPDKGQLSTLVYPQIKSTIMHIFEKRFYTASLDSPITDEEDTTFADMLHDPRTYDGEVFLNVAYVF